MEPASKPSPALQFDLGLALTVPTRDPKWLGKCLLMGLVALVPVAGWLALFGWVKAYADVRLRGETTIPRPGFGYLGAGLRYVFATLLPLLLLCSLLAVTSVAIAAVGSSPTIEGVAAGLLVFGMFAFGLASWLLGPAAQYLFLVEGELFAFVALRRMVAVARRGGWQYALFLIAVLVTGMLAQLGVLCFLVGLLVSLPYAYLVQAAAAAEYARTLAPEAPAMPEGGNAPSGNPFGISV